MSLWQRLSLSYKTLFFIKLSFVSLVIHAVVLFFLVRHCFEAPLSLVLQCNTHSSVKYIPLVASYKKIAELNAKNKNRLTEVEKGKKSAEKMHKSAESTDSVNNEGLSSSARKMISHGVVHEGMIKRAVKKATGMVIEKQEQHKKEKRTGHKKKENVKKNKNQKQKKAAKDITIKKVIKDATIKKDSAITKPVQQEKAESVEMGKEKGSQTYVSEAKQPLNSEEAAVVKKQEEGVGTTNDDAVMYVSYKEYDAIVAGAAFVDSMKDQWIAPVGMPKNSSCEVLITIDAKGDLAALSIERSSNVLVYDVAVKDALSSMEFPKEVYGKTLRVSFKS